MTSEGRKMTRPKLLDLYCCQGGASAGYAMAGFDVTGVDFVPQPRYPYPFVQADAIAYVLEHGHEYDVIHASPPCQAYSNTQRIRGNDHVELIAPTRDALMTTGRPWVIENVKGALRELKNPVTFCGMPFGLRTYRHRLFEFSGEPVDPPEHMDHYFPLVKMGRRRTPGTFGQYIGNFSGVPAAREDMRVPWMTRDGVRECIPPVYTEWIGRALMDVIK